MYLLLLDFLMKKYCYFKYRLTILFHCFLWQNKRQKLPGQLHFDQECQTVVSDIYAQISLTAGSIISVHEVRICLKKTLKRFKNSCYLNTLFTQKSHLHTWREDIFRIQRPSSQNPCHFDCYKIKMQISLLIWTTSCDTNRNSSSPIP